MAITEADYCAEITVSGNYQDFLRTYVASRNGNSSENRNERIFIVKDYVKAYFDVILAGTHPVLLTGSLFGSKSIRRFLTSGFPLGEALLNGIPQGRGGILQDTVHLLPGMYSEKTKENPSH
ncbi:MAG: hypothetical protein KAV87_08490 [Desulfobacteraceae bacterium]|nr:hypothetical protein [Desulfobacteraceae bacterium]